MEYQQTTTASGIRVITETMPAVRSAAIGMWIGVGSRDEAPDEHGCSHFLEHLLFKGTEHRSARRIAEELDAVGGEMNAFTSRELTCFYARVLDHDLPLATDVLADMLVAATNAADDVEAERQVVLSEIDIHLDSADDLVHSDLAEAVFGDHPLARETLGTVESITALTRDDIHGYFLDRYRPANLTVAAAGNVEHEDVVRLVETHLGDLGRPEGTPPDRSVPPAVPAQRVHLRNRPTEQAHVAVGGAALASRDPRRHALRVLNVSLGGGMSSRLFQEIRETRGLAYSTYSYASGFTDTGIYAAYAGTTPAKVDEVLKVALAQLDGIAEDVTLDEVERAKGALKGGLVLGLEDPTSRMMRIGKHVCLGTELVTVDEAIASIEAVDLDAVRAVAREVLGGARSLAVVGPFEEGDRERFERVVA